MPNTFGVASLYHDELITKLKNNPLELWRWIRFIKRKRNIEESGKHSLLLSLFSSTVHLFSHSHDATDSSSDEEHERCFQRRVKKFFHEITVGSVVQRSGQKRKPKRGGLLAGRQDMESTIGRSPLTNFPNPSPSVESTPEKKESSETAAAAATYNSGDESQTARSPTSVLRCQLSTPTLNGDAEFLGASRSFHSGDDLIVEETTCTVPESFSDYWRFDSFLGGCDMFDFRGFGEAALRREYPGDVFLNPGEDTVLGSTTWNLDGHFQDDIGEIFGSDLLLTV
ncbi:hypothetical protein SAY87_014483 [Trapa incisa]|uniref:Uncharacterized protein n=1 Tax=Trapa incisa TaxID=236973 RepID=A0AAN7H2U7_9MYRT|nr:hypothetical protein SAY87_014483 [Trapa incisa]